MVWSIIAGLSFGLWVYLLLGRGGFWREPLRPPAPAPEPARWPSVVAVVPARDEAKFVGEAVCSLLIQDYPGAFSVILVDDHSEDGTAQIARDAALAAGAADRLAVIGAQKLPAGWTGKLWAMNEGVKAARLRDEQPELILFTDADIVHHRTNLRELTARLAGGYDLVSLMVELRCESLAERALIPAFVFFFQMLYPFAWIRDRRKRTAGAAGGCMLVRRQALTGIGGLAAIRGEIIDDCALGHAIKRGGPIWLGLSGGTRSLRPYPELGDIWRMVTRTAYAQLGYSPAVLAAALLGLALIFLAPVAATVLGGDAVPLGLAAWAAMALAFLPTLRFYRRSPAGAPAFPAIALIYMAATMDSAWRYWHGRGGEWKGRIQQRSQA